MKRVKAQNGFTIYQYTKRDERDGHKVGEYCIYYSADVREFGTAYSTPEFEDLGTLAEALENIDGNYNGAAYSILSEQTTCVDFSDVEELAARLANGGTISEEEKDAADAAGVIVPENVETVEDVTEESTEGAAAHAFDGMTYAEFREAYRWTVKHYPDAINMLEVDTFLRLELVKYERPAQNTRWIETSREMELVDARNYMNIVDAVPFFRSWGGSERVECGYTYAGYVPTKVVSISPDKLSKTSRRFIFNRF